LLVVCHHFHGFFLEIALDSKSCSDVLDSDLC
jgi:hypothetical protein